MSDVTRRMAKSEAQVKATPLFSPLPWERDGSELMTAEGTHLADFRNWQDASFALRAVNSHNKLLEALKGLNGFFRDGSKFYISKLGGGITNGDQEIIDKLFMAAEAAIQSAEEQPK